MILGRSGSGKTTLLKILAHILKPRRGQLLLDPDVSSDRSSSGLASLAYIPQSLGLVRNMIALDNALIGALGYTKTFPSLMKKFPQPVVKEAQRFLSNLGLKDKYHQNVCELSGGERQRVAIARALMQKPTMILADEFVSQLDPVSTTEILEMMRKLTRQGITFLVTTHDLDLVRNYADRALVVSQGKIVYDHSIRDLIPHDVLKQIQ